MKKCAKCNNDYDLIEFPKDLSKKDGHKSYCFPCNRQVVNKSTTKRKEKRHDENIKNRDNISKYNKEYYKSKEKVLFEGFEIYKHTKDCIIKDNEIIFEWMENRFSHTGTTIESLTLSHDNFNLTQNAIKQLGL